MRRCQWRAPLIVLLAGGAAATAQEPERFSERLAVTEVEVSVRVLIGGRPAGGLTADDFEVFDRGEPRPILGFREIDLSPRLADARPPVPSPAATRDDPRGRRILLLFDQAYSRTGFLARALRGAQTMAASQLHPADQVAVGVYGSRAGLQLLDGFTADRGRLELAFDVVRARLDGKRRRHDAAVEALQGHVRSSLAAGGESARLDWLTDSLGRQAALALHAGPRRGRLDGRVSAPLIGIDGAGSDLRMEAALTVLGERSEVGAVRTPLAGDDLAIQPEISRVRAMTRSFGSLATLLRGLPGEKLVMLFSEGFAAGLLNDAAVLHHVEGMFEAFRRSGWTLHAIDVKGLPDAFSPAFNADALLFLAEGTGGELVENRNDLSEATRVVLDRTAISYRLTFQPSERAFDGSYHPIEVKLRAAPRGTRIQHRPGYYAPRSWSDKPGLERRLDAVELLLGQEEADELGVEAWCSAADSASAAALRIDLPGAALLAEPPKRGRDFVVAVHAYALGEGGAVHDLVEQEIRLGRDEHESKLERGGLRFLGDLELDPATTRVRVLVREAANGSLSLRTLPIGASASAAPHRREPPAEAASRDDTGWVVVREVATGG